MCRVYNIGGIALAITTLCLIAFGNYCGNRLVIFYWYYEKELENHSVQGIPLSFYGMLNFIVFNTFCLLSVLSHLRATFSDPGEIPADIVVPDYVDTVKLNNCAKCEMRWKPMRAHHCSECNKCIFKVSYFCFLYLILFDIHFFRWIIIALG